MNSPTGKLKSIEEEWEGFSKEVFRNTSPSKNEIEDMRKSFFAGALALFLMVERIGTPEISTQDGIDHLESVREEFTEFYKYLTRLLNEEIAARSRNN